MADDSGGERPGWPATACHANAAETGNGNPERRKRLLDNRWHDIVPAKDIEVGRGHLRRPDPPLRDHTRSETGPRRRRAKAPVSGMAISPARGFSARPGSLRCRKRNPTLGHERRSRGNRRPLEAGQRPPSARAGRRDPNDGREAGSFQPLQSIDEELAVESVS